MAWGIKCYGVLLGLLLVAGQAWAEEPTVFPQGGSNGFLGFDDTSAPTQVQDGRATDLQNVLLDISKGMRQRDGYSVVGDTLDVGGGELGTGVDEDECAITGLYYTKFSSGTERIVSTCGARFYYLNGSTWDTVSGITVEITASQNNQFVWTTALDEIIGTNGANPPIRYNGTIINTVNFTSLTASSRPTAAKTVAFFKNFLIFANTTENNVAYKTRFRWSNVGTTSTWTDADYVDIGALGGQEINAMAELYDNLYVFLTDSIYRVSFVAGADTFQVSKVTDDIGSIAKNSVQSITLTNAQNGLIFLDKDKKIYFFNGITVQDISTLMTTTMGALSASRLQYAVSTDTNTDYYLCVTNGAVGVNNLCLDLQYQLGEWTKHVNIPANAMAHVLDNNGREKNYFGSYEGFVYELNDDDLIDDVGTATGIITVTSRIDTTTASGLQVIYTSGQTYTVGALAGAPIEITAGPGVGELRTLNGNTTTGLIVTDDFVTSPTVASSFEVGAIDSFYTTKWYDFGQAARLKHFGELYFWGKDEPTASGITVSYATDFNTDIESQTISLDSTTGDAIWGSAVWGVSLWGSENDVFRQVKLDSQGRYFRVKWAEDDPAQSFHLYSWNLLYWLGDAL